MRILHTVKLYSPRIGGMYEVVKQLSEKLASKGHSVTIATLPLSKEDLETKHPSLIIEQFDIKGSYAKGLTGEVEKYRDFVHNGNFDIVTNFAAQQPMTDALITVLSSIRSKKVFVPTGFNGLYLKEFRQYFKNMPEWMRQYDINVVISKEQRDMYFAKEHGINNITIISNGSSREEFEQVIPFSIREKLFISKEKLLILHVGSHTGYKGHQKAIEIFSKANTGPATLLIIGNPSPRGCFKECLKLAEIHNNSKLFKEKNKNIIIDHLDRIETIAAYRESDIFIFPSNIEGGAPIVLFESMAASVPFLATDVGNTKEIAEETGGGIILPTEKDVPPENTLKNIIKGKIKSILEYFDIGTFHSDRGFVRAEIPGSVVILEKICHDKKLREKLGSSGHKKWLEKFTWEKIADQYEELYKKIINEK